MMTKPGFGFLFTLCHSSVVFIGAYSLLFDRYSFFSTICGDCLGRTSLKLPIFA